MVLRAIRLKRYLLSKLIQDLNLFGDPQRFRGERGKSWVVVGWTAATTAVGRVAQFGNLERK
jgi:hypothetical protein